MGYKNDGEAKLLGETVHKARLYKDMELGDVDPMLLRRDGDDRF